MIIRKLFVAMVALTILGGGQTVISQVIFSQDFNHRTVGAYNTTMLGQDWNGVSSNQGVSEGRVSIVSDGGGKALAVSYPIGMHGSGNTGAQWKLDFGPGLSNAYDAVELEYRVKFGDGFNFVRGGKLPGLSGGASNSGGSRPTGTDGFSARMMWRTNGSSGSTATSSMNGGINNKGNIVQYVYHPDQVTNPDPPGSLLGINGDDFDWDDGPSGTWSQFETNKWYSLKHRVVMNTPGTPGVNGGKGIADGVIMAWLDGVQVLNVNNIRFRDVASLQIDQLYFSTFFGGTGTEWNTTGNEVAYFDDFKITAITVPEPASLSILALFSTGLLARRSKR